MSNISTNTHQIKLLDVIYDNLFFDEALARARFLVKKGEKNNIFFLNIDCLRISQLDKEYFSILTQSNLVLPDGIGLRLITKFSGSRMKDNCNGTDFVPSFLALDAINKLKIFLLGSKEGVAERAAYEFRKIIPNVNIVGTMDGYFKDSLGVIKSINDSKAAILLVGMGVPRQEKWIVAHRNELEPILCIGVGALFDHYSRINRRAPKVLRLLQMEWLWRILLEPKRMISRYIFLDFPFLVRTILRGIISSLHN